MPPPHSSQERIPLNISPLPEKIGPYSIDGVYAQGGMSTLFLATEPVTHDQIIIKVLLPKFLSNKDLVQHFLNEGKIIAMSDHQNIVKLYEYGEWEGGLFIAMELVKGTSLRKILQFNPLPLKKALQILLQVCYATAHLHKNGIIHGDLKPENILISDQDQVKVIDFGISQVLCEKREKGHSFAGTPIYMSPETQGNSKSYSIQSDIYSIGIIAYELVMGKITHGRVVLSLAPRGMQPILQKALQPNPEDRYKDIHEFIHDVAEYIHSGEIQKDRHGTDYFFELFEQLEASQKKLLTSVIPKKTPHIGITTSYGVGLNTLYYRSFYQDNISTIVIAEGEKRDLGGVIDTYRLHTLFEQKNPSIEQIFIQAQKQKLSFHYSILTIDHTSKLFSWKKRGWGMLYTTHKTHPTKQLSSRTLEEQTLQGHCACHDRFVIIGCTSPTFLEFSSSPLLPIDVTLCEAIHTSHPICPQKQTNHILQKLRLRGDCILDNHPVCIASVEV